MKKRARKHSPMDKVNTYKTGGGIATSSLNTNEERLIGMFKNQFQPLPNNFDSDSRYMEAHTEQNLETQPEFEIIGYNVSEATQDQVESDARLAFYHTENAERTATSHVNINSENDNISRRQARKRPVSATAMITRASRLKIKYMKKLQEIRRKEHEEMKIKHERLLFYKEMREACKNGHLSLND